MPPNLICFRQSPRQVGSDSATARFAVRPDALRTRCRAYSRASSLAVPLSTSVSVPVGVVCLGCNEAARASSASRQSPQWNDDIENSRRGISVRKVVQLPKR